MQTSTPTRNNSQPSESAAATPKKPDASPAPSSLSEPSSQLNEKLANELKALKDSGAQIVSVKLVGPPTKPWREMKAERLAKEAAASAKK